jgi:malate dehydrogenase (oxaloacetate-decarboxylating)
MTQSDVLNIPRGMNLLDTPTLNKGTAFSEEERTEFGLQGLLPPHVETLDEQVVRAYEAFQTKDNDLERHIYLRVLQDTNEVLFYRLFSRGARLITGAAPTDFNFFKKLSEIKPEPVNAPR